MSRPNWAGQTAVILASGPSLRDCRPIVCTRENGPRLIAVNSTIFLHNGCDVAYAGDFLFWKKYHAEVVQTSPHAQRWTQDRTAAERFGLNWIKGVNRPGLGREHIHTGGNSGYQAINLAYLFGARRILLLGFDMKLGPKGEKHWHPDHPAPLVQSQTFGEWIRKFDALAADCKTLGVEVINCTPGSALKCFPMSTIEKELG